MALTIEYCSSSRKEGNFLWWWRLVTKEGNKRKDIQLPTLELMEKILVKITGTLIKFKFALPRYSWGMYFGTEKNLSEEVLKSFLKKLKEKVSE